MKKNIKYTISMICLVLIVSVFVAGADRLLALTTYTPPTGGPTDVNTNTDTPINIGISNQIKTGAATFGGLNIAGLGIIQGTLSVSTTTLATTSSGYTGFAALFDGKIAAQAYCDISGATCKTIDELSTPVGAGVTLGAPGADSGWVTMPQYANTTDIFTFHHNLGTTNTLVYIEGTDESDHYISQMYSTGESNTALGYYWDNKTANTIDITRESGNPTARKIRIKMWVVAAGTLTKSLNLNMGSSVTSPTNTDSTIREINLFTSVSKNVPYTWWVVNEPASSCTKSVIYSATGALPTTAPPVAITNWINGSSISSVSGKNVPSPTSLTMPSPSRLGLYKFTLTCGSLSSSVYIDHYDNSGQKHTDGTAFPF